MICDLLFTLIHFETLYNVGNKMVQLDRKREDRKTRGKGGESAKSTRFDGKTHTHAHLNTSVHARAQQPESGIF